LPQTFERSAHTAIDCRFGCGIWSLAREEQKQWEPLWYLAASVKPGMEIEPVMKLSSTGSKLAGGNFGRHTQFRS
jgi:hypothetical protein